MKLREIRKVYYDDHGELILSTEEKIKYDVYFINNNDFLYIDEDEYTPEKKQARFRERALSTVKFVTFRKFRDDGTGLTEIRT